MHLGVATFGPSTAGKTMVIKDIGRALGQYVVVVNCSSELGVSGLAKILKGVAMAGERYLSRECAQFRMDGEVC